MKKVSVFLADGFEEIEGLTVVDLLRRAGVEVTTVSITGDYTIHGAHGIDVQADKLFEEMNYDEQDMLVLPGGMPGTLNLGAHKGLEELLNKFYEKKKYLAAICAAPSVFGKYGFLNGRRATSYPGFEEQLTGAECVTDAVVVDEFVITSRGMGTAIPFSLNLIEVLIGSDKATEIGKSIIYYQ
ncbi:MAG: DJ-1/PfpI family protein [Tyzzerella sp.]|nr:DJ-1/PfpI family protein [Tyzzerella sp.]